MRIMLDTNVIISGVAFAGNERKLLNAIYSNSVTLGLSDYILLEAREVLERKFPGKETLLEEFTSLFQVEIATKPSMKDINEARSVIRDQKDAIILATAIKTKPDIFVSGDFDFHTSTITSLINVMHSKEAVALIIFHNKRN